MKKKITPKQIIAGSLAATMLAQACTEGTFYFADENVIDINNRSHPNGDLIIPLELNTTTEEKEYFVFLNNLAADIIKYPAIANSFAKDPAEFLERYGYTNKNISLDEGMMKLVLALGDEEINEAISQNDIKKLVRLCRDKKIVEYVKDSDIDRINTLLNKNPKLFRLNEVDDIQANASVVAFALAVVVGAAAFIWAVVVTHVAAANAAAAATVYAYAYAVQAKWAEIRSNRRNSEINQLWALKGGDLSQTYILGEECNKQMANDLIEALEKEFPHKLKGVNKESLRKIINLNLQP